MSINIELRKSNRIVTLNIDGKTPILSRNGSFNFHNSMELLCIAYGSCIGREIWQYFHFNNLNVEEFESFVITMEEGIIYLTIQHPEDLKEEVKKEINRLNERCQVSKQLKKTPIINFIKNKISKEELLNKDQTKRGCCGSK